MEGKTNEERGKRVGDEREVQRVKTDEREKKERKGGVEREEER